MIFKLLLLTVIIAESQCGLQLIDFNELQWPANLEPDYKALFEKDANLNDLIKAKLKQMQQHQQALVALVAELGQQNTAKEAFIKKTEEHLEKRLKMNAAIVDVATQELAECLKLKANETSYAARLMRVKPPMLDELLILDHGTYFISDKKVNWFMANQLCRQYRMELVSIDTAAKNDELVFQLDREHAYWTSGTDLGSEGSFYWASSGQPIPKSSQLWDGGQPDNYAGSENCVEYWRPRGKNFKGQFAWNDVHCQIQKRFICELSTEAD